MCASMAAKVDGHAIAVVEFARVLLQLFLCNDEDYVDLAIVSMAIAEDCRCIGDVYKALLQLLRRRIKNGTIVGVMKRIGGAGHNIIILVVRVHFFERALWLFYVCSLLVVGKKCTRIVPDCTDTHGR